jgi:hypothetical protein
MLGTMACWVVQSVEIVTAYTAGQAVAVGRFMPLSVVSSAEHLVTDAAAVGLPRCRWILQVGLHMT